MPRTNANNSTADDDARCLLCWCAVSAEAGTLGDFGHRKMFRSNLLHTTPPARQIIIPLSDNSECYCVTKTKKNDEIIMSVDQTNWKYRAEWMLSQFIDGGSVGDDGSDGGDSFDIDVNDFVAPLWQQKDPHVTSSSPLLENYSTSNDAVDGILVDSYGCGTIICRSSRSCCIGGGRCLIGGGSSSSSRMDNPCSSLILHWMKWVMGGAIKAYLSNPLCLALLPLIVGVAVGFWVGRYPIVGGKTTTKNNDNNCCKSSGEKIHWGASPSRIFYYPSLRFMISMIYLNPRRLCCDNGSTPSDSELLFHEDRDEQTRNELRTAIEVERESGIEPQFIPRHIAVIMDGNRRYGKNKYGNATRGHWDGSKTLIEFSKWCMSEGVQILTVYAFSTENWDRDASEVSSLMTIFCKYCDELRVEAIQRGIHIRVLTTDETKIPQNVKEGMNRMVSDTKHCDKFTMNICMSYGGRGEIVNACKSMAMDIQSGCVNVDEIDESLLRSKMLTGHCCDPDIVLRTSGEERLSNFLLWQVAYSEFFFLKKHWPELEKDDLLEVLRTFARGRKRRYGK